MFDLAGKTHKYHQRSSHLLLLPSLPPALPPFLPPSLPPWAPHLVVLGVELLGPVEGVALRAHVVADAVMIEREGGREEESVRLHCTHRKDDLATLRSLSSCLPSFLPSFLPPARPPSSPPNPSLSVFLYVNHVRVNVDILLGPKQVPFLPVLQALVQNLLQGLDGLGQDLLLPPFFDRHGVGGRRARHV